MIINSILTNTIQDFKDVSLKIEVAIAKPIEYLARNRTKL